jgi:hypothetical protein
MGVFDETTRKLAGDARAKTLKAERLAGPYESYEGYDDDGLGRLRSLSRRTRLRLAAAMDREALAMGAIGLAVGVAIGAALVWRRGRR